MMVYLLGYLLCPKWDGGYSLSVTAFVKTGEIMVLHYI